MSPDPVMYLRRPEGCAIHTKLICRKCGSVGEFIRLTSRHVQILRLLTKSKTNKEIGKELRTTEGTVKVYISRLFDVLGVRDRFAAAMWAIQHGEALGLDQRIISATANTPAATRNGVISTDPLRSTESASPYVSDDMSGAVVPPDVEMS